MAKEDFILMRLRGDRALYRGMFIVCAIASIGGLALAVAMFVGGGVMPGLSVLTIVATLAATGAGSRATSNRLDKAVREIEADPEGLTFPEDYSVPTFTAIEKAIQPAKLHFQQVLAYGIPAAFMIPAGVAVAIVVREEPVLSAVCLILTVLGLLLGVLAIQNYRYWKMAKQLEAVEE